MTHFAYITHILYCTLYKLQTTCLCVKYFVKNLHRAETIYTGGARGARDKYQVCKKFQVCGTSPSVFWPKIPYLLIFFRWQNICWKIFAVCQLLKKD